ncbi:MAG TPA: hypothetical protein VLV83_03025 [Acidobacteriota bacterium]|nr:hypothetical protein [Acidobacteriota bacterium]
MSQSRKRPTGEPVTDPDLLYDEDGVDPTLIRWMLSLTPTQRLQVLQDFVDATHRARSSLRRDQTDS